MRTAISNEVARIHADHYGRGPEAVRTYAEDQFVFTVMRGVLTRAEETLVDGGEVRLVRDVRLRFEELLRDEFTGAVADIVGRPVVDYHSQLLFAARHVVEIFVLGEEPDGRTDIG
jgi:uncharacterized protein YbcI